MLNAQDNPHNLKYSAVIRKIKRDAIAKGPAIAGPFSFYRCDTLALSLA
jgi:hypothetical protein